MALANPVVILLTWCQTGSKLGVMVTDGEAQPAKFLGPAGECHPDTGANVCLPRSAGF